MRNLTIPVDVDGIAKMLGVGVRYDPRLEDEDIIGQIGFEGDSPIVTINPTQNSFEPRRRFTLAHELGHFCLHRDRVSYGFRDNRKTMSRSQSYWDLMESEANNFAAQLLMPADEILNMSEDIVTSHQQIYGYNNYIYPGDLVRRLSSVFLVSNKAMEYRLLNLGVVRSEDF
jgi:Zn-dependent peptidase ImmA (M78 family)